MSADPPRPDAAVGGAIGASRVADPAVGRSPGADRVSTLELFFDLVFVFTITQLTLLMVEHPTWTGLAQAAVMLLPIWWMYGGYAWLTNHVPPDRPARRALLVGAMGAYLVVSLSIPTAFSGSGLAFGLAYLAIVLVHVALFLQADLPDTPGTVLGLAPNNVGWALVLVAGGAFGGDVQWVLWTVAGVLVWIAPRLLGGSDGFDVAAAHFVERHGLVVIVALGESVVAVGLGASGHAIDLPLVVVALLGLTLNAGLWWAYFGGDDARAEHALATAPPSRRGVMSLDGFGLWHLPILLGVILVAAGLEPDIAHPTHTLDAAVALMLAGGVALFFVGDAGFRRTLRIGERRLRLAVAVLALPTFVLGMQVAAVAELVALVALLGALIALEARAARQRVEASAARRGRDAPASQGALS